MVDADYEVRSDWLRALTGYFADPKVAVVQCPQAHRDFAHNAFRSMTNWEYDGFFRIGMHHRNERNAIIQHGTMTMVRRSALVDTGAWSEWTICEDAELGLRLMRAGHDLVYVDELMGKGLTPADFKAYKSQRYRWAFGAMQIMKARWKWMTSKDAGLTRGQRFHFLTGWFSWFGDALHLAFTLLAMLWTLGMVLAPHYFTLPMYLFLVPLIGFFVFKAAFGIILYRVRVPCSWKDTIAASIASMSLSHAIARGIYLGLWRKKGEFVRTAKSRRIGKKPSAFVSVARGTRAVRRARRVRRRHDQLERHQLHRGPPVDRDPRRAGDPVRLRADRRVDRAPVWGCGGVMCGEGARCLHASLQGCNGYTRGARMRHHCSAVRVIFETDAGKGRFSNALPEKYDGLRIEWEASV